MFFLDFSYIFGVSSAYARASRHLLVTFGAYVRVSPGVGDLKDDHWRHLEPAGFSPRDVPAAFSRV